MNRKEFFESGGYSIHRYKVRKLLKQWKLENNITERCVAHHRDDTEECRRYNEEHYELWGFNLDGTFEEGKYVQFMTVSKHSFHHSKGKTHSDKTKEKIRIGNIGKKRSEETRTKMSIARQDKHLSNDTKAKISAAKIGKKRSEETRAKISAANKGKVMSAETRKKISESLTGKYEAVKSISYMYNIYKLNGGKLKWNEFRKAISDGEITFQLQPISVYF